MCSIELQAVRLTHVYCSINYLRCYLLSNLLAYFVCEQEVRVYRVPKVLVVSMVFAVYKDQMARPGPKVRSVTLDHLATPALKGSQGSPVPRATLDSKARRDLRAREVRRDRLVPRAPGEMTVHLDLLEHRETLEPSVSQDPEVTSGLAD